MLIMSMMDVAQARILQARRLVSNHEHEWATMDSEQDDTCSSSSLDNSSEASTVSTSSEMVDDASSPASCSSSNSNSDSLFDLSDLMVHLPIKRGLSKYYQGKSKSFTCLSRVVSIEDLAKKETPCRRKLKASRSQGNGLDCHKSYTLPKPTIYKKVSRGCRSPLTFPSRRSGSFPVSRPPPVPLQKKI